MTTTTYINPGYPKLTENSELWSEMTTSNGTRVEVWLTDDGVWEAVWDPGNNSPIPTTYYKKNHG